ncbi:hypothetical protein AMTR_s00001p00269300 [Amborella trichopoda]|uniref:D-isomer specific 2-hydroxyacid dehydrogenase NAD-binding domain-containing protein n=1 Tax=Amborella trichopoda TaxID=13333 RepID=W1NMQ5_AMBTC|nr:hypothetical protein AMTR_s00001p00269300 [Amborella trichopoda]
MSVCRRRGVAVGNLGAVFAEEVADYAIGLLLAVLHRIAASDRNVRQGHFCSESHSPFGTKLSGKHVGIVGLGSIGLAIARRLEPFGCTISYHSRTEKPSTPYTYFPDIAIWHMDALLALGKNGVLINVARGAVIDEKEMVRCLVEGELGGAGLDVFENEPHVPHELLLMDNVVLSPHSAIFTSESLLAAEDIVLGNLKAFFSNRPLLSTVE